MSREQLIRRGFTVARKPYLPDAWCARDPERNQFTIHFERAVYVRWGEVPQERPLAELLGLHLSRAEAVEAAQSRAGGPVGFFVAECLAAGFVLDHDRNAHCCHTVQRAGTVIDLGNRWLIYRGVPYLACEWARSLVDPSWNTYQLADLTGRLIQHPAPRPRFLAPSDAPPVDTSQFRERTLLFSDG